MFQATTYYILKHYSFVSILVGVSLLTFLRISMDTLFYPNY